jgi:membrane-associated phospholipid phosphatase
LFGDLVGDFRNLPSKESAAWLGVGAAAALVGHAGDTPVTQVMSVRSLEEPFESGRVIGGAAMQMGGALATYSIGRISGSTRTAAVGAELFRAQILSQSMTSLIKLSASRTRPDGSNNLSFPSGHTASAFATATVLERNFGWKVGIPAYAAAAFVGASRIQSQKHYLSDVAFGAAIGILAGRTVTIGPKEARFAVAPFAVDGGGGVGFTLLNK